MRKCLKITALLLLITVTCPARNSYVGVFSSYKGFGCSYGWSLSSSDGNKSDTFIAFTAYAETSDMITGRCNSPGLFLNFSQNHILKDYSLPESDFILYAGPGVSCGYLRDWKWTESGFMLAASADIGIRWIFSNGISIDLSMLANAGLIFGRDKDPNSNYQLTFYKRGLIDTLAPQITIAFSL